MEAEQAEPNQYEAESFLVLFGPTGANKAAEDDQNY